MTWFTAKQACKYMKVSRRTLSRYVEEGLLKCSKPVGQLRFRREWLDEFLERGMNV